MKPTLFVFCLLCQVISTWAQSITGTVIDAKTQRPLPGCSIRVGSRGTITNENGRFLLTLSGMSGDKLSLVVSNLGYANKIVTYTGQKTLTIALDESQTSLNEVVVHSSARGIVLRAIDKIPTNYPIRPFMMRGMLREYNRFSKMDYLYLLEAQLNVRVKPYTISDGPDIEVLQKNKQVFRNLDSTLFIHWGNTASMVDYGDFVHRQLSFVNKKKLNNYTYELLDVTTLDGQSVYVVGFRPRNTTFSSAGKLFIDTQSLAFVGGEIWETGRSDDDSVGHETDARKRVTKTNYQRYGGKWYLRDTQHARTLQKTTTRSELLVEFVSTDIDTTATQRISYNKTLQRQDILLDTPVRYDSLFWAQQPGTLRNTDLDAFLRQPTSHKPVASNTQLQASARSAKTAMYIFAHFHAGYGIGTLPGLLNQAGVGIDYVNSAGLRLSQQSSISAIYRYGLYFNQRFDLPLNFVVYHEIGSNFGIGGLVQTNRQLGIGYKKTVNTQHRPIRISPFISIELTRFSKKFVEVTAPETYLKNLGLRGTEIEPILEKTYTNVAASLQVSLELKRRKRFFINVTYHSLLSQADRLYGKETTGFLWLRKKREINEQGHQFTPINSSLTAITYQIGLTF